MALTFQESEWLHEHFEREPGVARYFEEAPSLLGPLREALPIIRKAYPTEKLILRQEFELDAPEDQPDPPPIIVVDKEWSIDLDRLPPHHLFIDAPEVTAESERLWVVLGEEGYGRADFFFHHDGNGTVGVHFAIWYAEDFEGTPHDPYAGLTEDQRKEREQAEMALAKAEFITSMTAAGFTVTDASDLEAEAPTTYPPATAFDETMQDLEAWLHVRHAPHYDSE